MIPDGQEDGAQDPGYITFFPMNQQATDQSRDSIDPSDLHLDQETSSNIPTKKSLKKLSTMMNISGDEKVYRKELNIKESID